MQSRDDQGRFINKSESERKVRSIRAVDETWVMFGEIVFYRVLHGLIYLKRQ